jgi:hypothetical protein
MESEITLGLHRQPQTAPEIPNYFVNTQTEGYNVNLDSAKRPGFGVINGAGNYKAGTLVTITGYPTDGWWGTTNKTSGISSIQFAGAGTYNGFIDSATIATNGGEVTGRLQNAVTFVDGNKTIIASFVH